MDHSFSRLLAVEFPFGTPRDAGCRLIVFPVAKQFGYGTIPTFDAGLLQLQLQLQPSEPCCSIMQLPSESKRQWKQSFIIPATERTIAVCRASASLWRDALIHASNFQPPDNAPERDCPTHLHRPQLVGRLHRETTMTKGPMPSLPGNRIVLGILRARSDAAALGDPMKTGMTALGCAREVAAQSLASTRPFYIFLFFFWMHATLNLQSLTRTRSDLIL